MRLQFKTLARLMVSAILLLTVVWIGLPAPRSSVQAQSSNLLQNPGFEEPYIAVGGDSSLQVANSWHPWSLTNEDGPSSINQRPCLLYTSPSPRD